jgi:hypothetical protein
VVTPLQRFGDRGEATNHADSGKGRHELATDTGQVRCDQVQLDMVQHVDNEVAEHDLSGIRGNHGGHKK